MSVLRALSTKIAERLPSVNASFSGGDPCKTYVLRRLKSIICKIPLKEIRRARCSRASLDAPSFARAPLMTRLEILASRLDKLEYTIVVVYEILKDAVRVAGDCDLRSILVCYEACMNSAGVQYTRA